MHYIHKVGCTSVRQVPVTGTHSFRLTTQIWRDLCLSETQVHRSSDLWVSHKYTCVDPQVTQTHAQPYLDMSLSSSPLTEPGRVLGSGYVNRRHSCVFSQWNHRFWFQDGSHLVLPWL